MKPGDDASQPEQRGNVQVHLAWLRTRMALERTLDAWVRTAAALIGFGFTIVQFFEHFDQARGISPAKGLHLSRYVGLMLIGIGTLALGIALVQYQRVLKYMWSEEYGGVAGIPGMRRFHLALIVAVLLMLVGGLAFFTILLRGEPSLPGK